MNLNDLPIAYQASPAPRPAAGVPEAAVLLELQALVLRHARFDAAATAVVSELALRLDCTRVSLALRDATRPQAPARVAAVSHGAALDARLQAVRALADAADEAIDRAAPVEHPPRAGAAPGIAVAHAALAQGTDAAAVLGVPFSADGADGALLFERPAPLDEMQRALAMDAALFVGPVLLLKARVDAPLPERLRALLNSPIGGRTAGEASQRSGLLVAAAAALGLLIALCWPTTFHVVAPARVEGLGQRVVPAPADGFLKSVLVRPGEAVKAGQVLATLDDREPALEAERAQAERVQFDRQYRDALTREDAAAAVIAGAKLEQATARHELAQRRLERTRLVAPFDGVLLSGDLAPALGTPVQRGQELMIVAPSQGWRIVAEVDEQDVLAVQPGQKARVLFAALAGRSADFTLSRVAPVAQALDGRNVFEAEGQLAEAGDGLRPGLRGIARIEAGERAPAAVWWERGTNALRRVLWSLMT